MKNYLEKKDKYFKNYASAVVTNFRNIRYGITACCNNLEDFDLAFMRYELSKWQSSGDYCSLSEIRSNYKKWLPVNLCSDDMCYININVNECDKCAKSFHITLPQSTWTLVHNLGFNPSVTTTDNDGQEILGIVNYVDSNTVTITFSEPVIGWAYIS